MNLYDNYGGRLSRRENLIYHLDEADSGCQSCSSNPGYFEDEFKAELARSEKRRSALNQSLRNAHNALQHQKNCLQEQANDIANSDVTLKHLLLKQELLESRFTYLKGNNFCPGFLSPDILGSKEHQRFHYRPEITDSIRRKVCQYWVHPLLMEWKGQFQTLYADLRRHPDKFFNYMRMSMERITDLESEINDIKTKMRRYSLLKENNSHRWSIFEERKNKEAEYMKMQEEMRQHAEIMEAKCSNAQRERDNLELEITSLHSGLHQAKVTSKELEKRCVKLQSQVVANRDINESLHLEVSALKNHSHTLENAVKGSASENKSLHLQIENLQQENQSLLSQKELLFSIMKKKEKRKHHCEERSKSATREMQIHNQEDNNCMNPKDGSLFFGSLCTPSLKNTRRPRKGEKLRTKKEVKCEFKDDDRKHEKELQLDFESKKSEMNTEIILACYQHLADLQEKLECLLKSNVTLDKEKQQNFKCLLESLKELKNSKVSSDKSRDQVEELLNEHNGLRENYHMRLNQITSVIIELKHLRQAYNGILKNSEDPNDRDAMAWISRVRAIKDSLKLLKLQEQTTDSM